MRMPSRKNIANAVMHAAVLALAACDRADKTRIDTAPLPAMRIATVDDGDAHLPTEVERRHFAIYNTYRVLSGETSGAAMGAQEEGLLYAAAAKDGDVFACSMHAALLQD